MTKDMQEVLVEDLRALLFWAQVGVELSKGGSHEDKICDAIAFYAKEIGHPIEGFPRFGKRFKETDKENSL